MTWQIHPDGSFDLITPAAALRRAWPALDHQPVRCTRVDFGDGRLVYHLPEGALRLDFADAAVTCRLDGFKQAPHWVQPIHGARIETATRVFRQGIGFSGPTGALPFTDLGETQWSLESYMLVGLFDEDEQTTTLAAHHHRDFLFRANLHHRVYRHNFRNREIDETIRLFEAGFRTERIPLDGALELPALHVRTGAGLFDTLRQTARDIAAANDARAPVRPRYHYCSWYHHSANLTEELLLPIVDGMAEADPDRHVQTVQIDDGYQRSRGDWLTFNHRWPRGLKPVFEHIQQAGYTPGVWVGPFMVGCSSRLATEHPDWLLKGLDGQPLVEWRHYHGSSPDFEHHILDTSHPEALAWVHEVFRTFRSWGVRFFKTDFVEWGYKDSTRVRRHTPGKTGAQYFDDVLRTIREAIGDDSHWLGCITYFAPSVGYCDSMRVSSDVGVQWAGHGGTGNDGVGGGTPNMIEESYATLYMNQVLWQNDPDVLFLRDWHVFHQDHETRSLACWHGLLGHSINTSDEVGDLPPERLAWWRWLRPQEEPWTAHLPYFAKGHPFRVVVRDYPRANGWAVLLLNEYGDRRLGRCRVQELIGRPAARAFAWSPDGAADLGEVSKFVEELDGHASVLRFLSRDGAPPPANLNLGGSCES